MYFATTTSILIFKKDDSFDIVEKKFEIKTKLVESYSLLWRILKIKPVQLAVLILITTRVSETHFTNLSNLVNTHRSVQKMIL